MICYKEMKRKKLKWSDTIFCSTNNSSQTIAYEVRLQLLPPTQSFRIQSTMPIR